nr:trypsin-like peptidase domain-containing protein [Noviherbaspirillum massiliense]
MKKVTLYSSSTRNRPARSTESPPRSRNADSQARPPQDAPSQPQVKQKPGPGRLRGFISRHERLLLVASAALLSLCLLIAYIESRPQPRKITQRDIDAAVLHTLDHNVLPSPEAKAFAAVQRSVVRVRQLHHVQGSSDDRVTGVGTGVVIVDNGTILTNLHVVAGAERVQVIFADGTESEAAVAAEQPENDLAVLQAKSLPDDLVAATLRSTSDLSMGDRVIAVGFPFGIGPSVSSGVVSGLRREYLSPEGKRLLTNLIQFDAAANPGNSGGPLVTMDGQVVGIVTAILNPSGQGLSIGIGFAVPIENAAAAVGELPF